MDNSCLIDQVYMRRCLELARKAARRVSPNPMVGAVVVYDGKIIGEGYHREWGGPHAEVNAIASVKDESLLKESTIYVSLEPCSHWGKTPPCAQLIIDKGVKKVVIGAEDPFISVSGRGIRMLQDAGIEVKVGVIPDECKAVNKAFYCKQINQRPYVCLKWAQTADGYVDIKRELGDGKTPLAVSSPLGRVSVHELRSRYAAILVGWNTAMLDNPKLDIRFWSGKEPLRVVIDRDNTLAKDLHLLDGVAPTLVISSVYPEEAIPENVNYEVVDFQKDIEIQILSKLASRGIDSVLVEGGVKTLQKFIDNGLWDEARIEYGSKTIGDGIEAPSIKGTCRKDYKIGQSRILELENTLL